MSGGPALRAAAAARAKRMAGSAVTVKVRCLRRGYGLLRWGNLRRTTPLAEEELTAAELAVQDPRFPVLTTILARIRS